MEDAEVALVLIGSTAGTAKACVNRLREQGIKAGLIKLKDDTNIAATVQDVVENTKNLKFQELEAAQVPRAIDDVDLAVINSNFAMQVQLNPVKDSLFIEDATSPYVNIVAVRNGDEERPEIKALIKALQSEKVKKFIEEKYNGAVVATF